MGVRPFHCEGLIKRLGAPCAILALLAPSISVAETGTDADADTDTAAAAAPGVEAPEAAPAADEQPSVTVGATLDVETLLTSQDVLLDQVSDSVWTISAQPGRRLIQLPLILEAPATEVEVVKPSVTIRGGRFLAWRIADPAAAPVGRRAVPRGRPGPGRFGPGGPGGPVVPGEPGGLSGYGGPNGIGVPGRPIDAPNRLERMRGGLRPSPVEAPAAPGIDDASSPALPPVPADAPRLARRVTIRPDGAVIWKLDRFIPGGEIAGGQALYALKLRPDLIDEMAPQRPQRSRPQRTNQRGGPGQARPRGASRDATAERNAQAEYRAAVLDFQKMRAAVRALPDRFETAMPRPMWAVFEVSDTFPDISFNGPTPLPWRIGSDDFELLRSMTGGRAAGRGELDPRSTQAIARLADVAATGHPLSHRAVASALASGQWAANVQEGDAVYTLFEALLRSPDGSARRVALRSLADTDPPTAATIALQRNAFGLMTPDEKVLALRGQLQIDATDPIQVSRMLATLNATLAEPDGAPPGAVLEAVAEGLAVDPGRSSRGPALSDVSVAVARGINFDAVPVGRRDGAIRYVVRAAGASPVAAQWLDTGLLGSGDTDLVRRTLELTAASGGASPVVGPVAHWIMRLVSGPAAAGAAHGGSLELSGPIPIAAPSHSIFRALQSGDPQMRALAWRALAKFRIDDGSDPRRPRRPRRPGRGAAPSDADLYTMILDAALALSPVPREAADFFANHPADDRAAAAALVRLAAESQGPAAGAAARHLFGSARPIGEVLGRMEAPQRGGFGVAVYGAFDPGAAPVAGLLREDARRGGRASWFARSLAEGYLPGPAEWAAQYPRGEQDLLALVGGEDEELARGAVTALVASAGGDSKTAEALARSMRNEPDRSVEALAGRWAEAKKQIYASSLAGLSGFYRLTAGIGAAPAVPFGAGRGMVEPPNPGGPGGPGRPGPYGPGGPPPRMAVPGEMRPGAGPMGEPAFAGPKREVVLGVVELVAEQQSVRLVGDPLDLTVPPDHLAIRVAQIEQIKSFDDPTLEDLDLGGVNDPLDLLPREGGVWSGRVVLRDGSVLELSLTPTQP